MLLQNVHEPFSTEGAPHRCVSLLCRGRERTPEPSQTLAFELRADNNLDGPLSVWPGGHNHDFQKKKKKKTI